MIRLIKQLSLALVIGGCIVGLLFSVRKAIDIISAERQQEQALDASRYRARQMCHNCAPGQFMWIWVPIDELAKDQPCPNCKRVFGEQE